MGRGERARARSTDQVGRLATRPVSGPQQRVGSGAPGDGMISEKSRSVWEAAYRQYGRAVEARARSGKGDPAAAREMARASRAVAAAWRQIAAASSLPWWILAAIESAAGAFECQAREYETGNTSEGS